MCVGAELRSASCLADRAVVDHGRPERRAELDRERADAAAAAVDQQRLARAAAGPARTTFDQTVQATSGSAAASTSVDAGRHRQQLPGGHRHPLGVAAAGQQRADLAGPPPSRSTPAPTALITPGALQPGVRRARPAAAGSAPAAGAGRPG